MFVPNPNQGTAECSTRHPRRVRVEPLPRSCVPGGVASAPHSAAPRGLADHYRVLIGLVDEVEGYDAMDLGEKFNELV